jgi:hypothetical protein
MNLNPLNTAAAAAIFQREALLPGMCLVLAFFASSLGTQAGTA